MTAVQIRALLIAGAASIALLWLLPPVGFVACLALLVIAPPWGRTLAERGLISILVILGLVAIAIPRASEVPVTTVSAHAGLSALTALAILARLVPRLNRSPLPAPTLIDGLVAGLVIGLGGWLIGAYLGQPPERILSGLFFTGWDNQGHFTPFANTIEVGATSWPTADSSIAWNQWYPSLHSTLWSLAQLASQASAEVGARVDLLWPYVGWTAASFALSMGALAWIAGDLTGRLAKAAGLTGAWVARLAPAVAVLGFTAFALLGSPQLLYNYGFTNFAMATATMALAAYLSARSWRSARTLGWFLIPLSALAINGMWTPLVLGLLPSAAIVAIALFRLRPVLAIGWALASGALVGGTVWIQSRAIVAVAPGTSGSFLEDLGAVGTGMSPFNLGLAMAGPLVAVLAAVQLVRVRSLPLAIAVGGPSVAMVPFVILAIWAADTADLSRLSSYYVLKALNALLLVNATLLAAGLAIVAGLAMQALAARGAGRPALGIAAACAGLLGLTLLGYPGAGGDQVAPGFAAAPGIQAGLARAASVDNDLVGDSIIRAQQAALAEPGTSTLMWDGGGTLVNLWLASLNRVLSSDDHRFYAGLPPFPYEDEAQRYVDFAVGLRPSLDLSILWFRGVSQERLQNLVRQHPDRITLVRVPMPSSALCLECSL